MDNRATTHRNALIFDFDGTICHLFGNYNLDRTLLTLHESMKKYEIRFDINSDAFDVFDCIIQQTKNQSVCRQRALMDANCILVNAEMEAIETAIPIRGFLEVFPSILGSTIPIGIATNNSFQCVDAYMKKYFPCLSIPIVGRIDVHPELMKPNPWSILSVLKQMNCRAKYAVIIGDTARDYHAAKNAGCEFIGLAATKMKEQRLLQVLSKNAIVHDYFDLVPLL